MQPVLSFLLVGALACGERDDIAHERLLGLYVFTHGGMGMVGNVFAAKQDVYLGVTTQVERPHPAVVRDFTFRVVDDQGLVLSSDDAACRHVVLDRGWIAIVVEDELECSRETPGVRLAPFFDSLTSRYRAELVPADGDPTPIASVDFAVGMIPDEGGVCGNGELEPAEQCDDGNLDAGDGCDAFCASELAPVCGDGVVDHGESCDDGNTMCMDGCDERCQIEPPGESGSSDDDED